MNTKISTVLALSVVVTLGSPAAMAHEAMTGHMHPHENALADALPGVEALVVVALVLLFTGIGVYWCARRKQ